MGMGRDPCLASPQGDSSPNVCDAPTGVFGAGGVDSGCVPTPPTPTAANVFIYAASFGDVGLVAVGRPLESGREI